MCVDENRRYSYYVRKEASATALCTSVQSHSSATLMLIFALFYGDKHYRCISCTEAQHKICSLLAGSTFVPCGNS